MILLADKMDEEEDAEAAKAEVQQKAAGRPKRRLRKHLQDLVVDSPVSVLLDINANWCGPCKPLSSILEELVVKCGVAFRFVKINCNNERAISQALQVSALLTIFGSRWQNLVHVSGHAQIGRNEEHLMGALVSSPSPILEAASSDDTLLSLFCTMQVYRLENDKWDSIADFSRG